MLTYTFLICTCVLAAAAQRPYQKQKRSFESVRAKIQARHAAYASALKDNDKDTLLSLYHPNVRVLANGFPTQIGTDAMALNLDWIKYVGDVVVNQEELGPEDPNASVLYERTNIIIKKKDGKVMTDQRRLIVWYKQDDGGYLAYIVMSNVDE